VLAADSFGGSLVGDAGDFSWLELVAGSGMVDPSLLAVPASRYEAMCRRHGMCENGCGHSRVPLGVVGGKLICDDCQGLWAADLIWNG